VEQVLPARWDAGSCCCLRRREKWRLQNGVRVGMVADNVAWTFDDD